MNYLKMKKTSFSIIWIYFLVSISLLLLGAFLSNIYYNSSEKTFQFTPTIVVKDSTDLAIMGSYTSREITALVNDHVETIVNSEFDRTINYLNFSVTLFGIFLTLIIVAFGFFTTRKMAEAKEMLDEIKAAPNAVMKKYYDNQLKDLFPKLLSSNQREKYDAILRISSNSQVEEEHYDILANVMEREYDNISSNTTMNVLNLFDTLSRLDYSRTITLGYKIFETHYDHPSMHHLTPQLTESLEEKHKEIFVRIISSETDSKKANSLINNIESYEAFDEDMLTQIVAKSPSQISQRILGTIIQKKKKEIDLRPIILNSGKTALKLPHFNQFLNLLSQNHQLEYDLIEYLIGSVIKNDFVNEDQIGNMIRNLSAFIKEDDTLYKLILHLKKSVQLKVDANFLQALKNMGLENAPRVQEMIQRVSKPMLSYEGGVNNSH